MEQQQKRQTDWLSVGFLVVAIVCMAVSVPATYSVAALTHASIFGAALVVFVAEVMAFGAKIATRWFHTWHRPLNSFAVVMLAAAVLPNAVEGWNALWRENAAEGAWADILATSVFGVHVFALLIVGVWAALPPLGVYLALSFWVRRQYELETEQTPEALVNRRLQPLIIEMEVQRQLDEALLGLLDQRRQLVSPAPLPGGETMGTKLDRVLAGAGLTREAAREMIAGGGQPPEGLDQVLVEVLFERACETCGKQLSPGERGVAIKYARRHNLPVQCTSCRR